MEGHGVTDDITPSPAPAPDMGEGAAGSGAVLAVLLGAMALPVLRPASRFITGEPSLLVSVMALNVQSFVAAQFMLLRALD
ncbi:uncharacterized protein BCR38DRAFT_480446 [Pseudomassariella vexata]|uniref:Uncharacterized protein n=1 Tax=Pseudomassariella vexata TaxID=1141098 RepID=A0A1Y2EKB1_9PEZI|nr:uncharacterized protein BCR38DRAFT_480446 [Pseudomassariella vexata]ORY71972.1 hypothetical protein BCR38DRAFT_480446 [Pseudomassariella vexata]